MTEVLLLRCVDDRGNKRTAVGDVARFRTLLTGGEVSNPDGITLDAPGIPSCHPGLVTSRSDLGAVVGAHQLRTPWPPVGNVLVRNLMSKHEIHHIVWNALTLRMKVPADSAEWIAT